jgi:hypothetical protein
MGQVSETRAIRQMPWWTSPAGINFGFLLPVLLLIATLGDSSFSGLTIRGIRFLDGYYIAIGCVALLVSGVSGWIGSFVVTDARTTQPEDTESWDRAAMLGAAVALLAYVIWFREFIFNPLLLLQTLRGEFRPDRSTIQLTTGITSLANMAPAFFSVYAFKVIALRVKVSRGMHILCAALVGFTLFRVYAWSERLAMIEAFVPFGLAIAARWAGARGNIARTLVRLGPFFALPMLILYFASFEYVRSWQSDTYNKHLGFWEFAVGRLASYYYTSLNNGAGMLVTMQWPTYKYENVLSWLHRAPFIGSWFSKLVDLQYEQLSTFLTKFGDVEFNNPSGIYAVVYDIGLPLGTVYFCVVGFVGGMIYRSYRRGAFSGVLLYPLFFIAFLEVFRFPYLGTSRAFTWLLGIVLTLLVKRSPRPLKTLEGRASGCGGLDATT